MTTSARGLSFGADQPLDDSTTGAVARTVIVLAVLFCRIVGCTGDARDAHHRVHELLQLGDVSVRDVERPDHQIVVLHVLGGVLRDDQDGLVVENLVESGWPTMICCSACSAVTSSRLMVKAMSRNVVS